MARMCFSFNPKLGASTLWPSRKSRALDEVFITSFHSNISCVTVLLSSRVGIDEKRSYVQRYLLSIIRPPAHDITVFGIASRIETAPDLSRFLKDCYVGAHNISIANEERRRGQRGDAAPDQVNRCAFFLHLLRS